MCFFMSKRKEGLGSGPTRSQEGINESTVEGAATKTRSTLETSQKQASIELITIQKLILLLDTQTCLGSVLGWPHIN